MSILDSEETPYQFLRSIQAGINSVETFSGKREDFRAWHSLLLEQIDAVDMGYLCRSDRMPACVVTAASESLKQFYSKLEKHVKGHRHIRMKVKESLPKDLRRAVDQQPLTTTLDFLANVTMPEEAKVREQIITRVTEHLDDNNVQFVERLPSLFQILKYLKQRMSAVTALEKTNMYDNFSKLRISDNNFEGFVTEVRDARSALSDVGVKVDDTAVLTLITSHLPATAAVAASSLLAQNKSIDEVIQGLITVYRNQVADKKSKDRNEEPTVEALPVFSSPSPIAQIVRSGARGRGRKNRGGRGNHRGGARGGRFEFREGKSVCACCGGTGHKQAQCPSEPSSSHAQPVSNTAQNAKKDVCGYCNHTGHKTEKCWTKARDEKNKSAMLAQTVSATAFVLSLDLHAFKNSSSVEKGDLLADTGAEMHVCNDVKWFTNMKKLVEHILVHGVNPDHPMKVEFIGKISLVLDIKGKPVDTTISDVLLLPSCPCSLLSVGWLAKRKNVSMTITAGDGNTPGKMVATRDGVVLFEGEQPPNSTRFHVKRWQECAGRSAVADPAKYVVSARACSNINSNCVNGGGGNNQTHLSDQFPPREPHKYRQYG